MVRVVPTVLLFVLLCLGRASAAPILDPTGDTFNGGAIDLTSYEFLFDGSKFTVSLGFAAPILPASAVAPNSLFGYIDLDTDKDTSTGVESFINLFAGLGVPGPPIALGVDFYIDLFSEILHPGFIDVFSAAGDLVGMPAIIFGASSVTFDLESAWLDGATDFNVGILVGDVDAPTDRAPGDAVPEPATLSMLAAGLGALATGRRWAARHAR